MDCQCPLNDDRDRTRPSRKGPGRRCSAVAALALLAALAASPPPATAASHRLSQGLPFSDVTAASAQLSPDGRFAVYIHDATVDEARELWSVRVAGGAPVRLSGLLPGGVTVDSFADQRRQPARRLHRRPGDRRPGRALQHPHRRPRRVLDPAQRGAAGRRRRLRPPDQPRQHAGRLCRRPTGGRRFDAWSVPIDGGTPIRLRPLVTLAGSRRPRRLRHPRSVPTARGSSFTPTSPISTTVDLWSARVDGTGGIVQLTEATAASHNVFGTRFSPDSSRVVYFADQQRQRHHGALQRTERRRKRGEAQRALTPGGNV